MRKRLYVPALVSSLVLGATALPAFSADNGTVQGTVTAGAPPAPCLTVSPSSVDFGTLDFGAVGQAALISITNCGTGVQKTLAAGSNATGAAGEWTLSNTLNLPCTTSNRNQYGLALTAPFVLVRLSTAPQFLGDAPSADLWGVGQSLEFAPNLYMPCGGSNGTGETKSFSITFTAVVA